MNLSENPYASPSAPQHSPSQLGDGQPVTPAGQGARLANFIIDYFAQFALGFVFGMALGIVGGEEGAAFLETTPGFLLGIPILLVYYFVFEITTSRTLGKLITGTKVVNENGGTPTLGQILGRTFCRLIPFEAFSFFGTPPRGWHDSLSKTYVVKSR
ncbi:MAG: RDD family protein [Pirellulaceae bacterium]